MMETIISHGPGKTTTVHSGHSFSPLKILGSFSMTGPQAVGGPGQAPAWVGEAFDSNPKIQQVAVNYKTGGAVYSRIRREGEEPEPEAPKFYGHMPKENAEALFKLSGIQVLSIKPLPSGYSYAPTDSRYFEQTPEDVWWFVKTVKGWIEIGWRKRVIAINWADTSVRRIVTEDDVTKGDDHVHAHTTADAVQYLTTLAQEINKP